MIRYFILLNWEHKGYCGLGCHSGCQNPNLSAWGRFALPKCTSSSPPPAFPQMLLLNISYVPGTKFPFGLDRFLEKCFAFLLFNSKFCIKGT